MVVGGTTVGVGPGTVDCGCDARVDTDADATRRDGRRVEPDRGDHQVVEGHQRRATTPAAAAVAPSDALPSGAVATGAGTHTDGCRWSGRAQGGGRGPQRPELGVGLLEGLPSAAISVAAWSAEMRVAG